MANKKKELTDFYQKERPKLVGYIRKWLNDSNDRDAEDTVQDVMLSLYGREDREDDDDEEESISNNGSYIYSSLKNRVIDAYRNKKNRHIRFDDIADTVSGYTLSEILSDARYDTHNAIEKKYIIGRICQAVDKLNPEQKAIWIATEMEGQSFDELAELWDTPIGTLLARKHRAVQKLRKLLSDLK